MTTLHKFHVFFFENLSTLSLFLICYIIDYATPLTAATPVDCFFKLEIKIDLHCTKF